MQPLVAATTAPSADLDALARDINLKIPFNYLIQARAMQLLFVQKHYIISLEITKCLE